MNQEVDKVFSMIETMTGVTKEQLVSPTRVKNVVAARHLAMHTMREHLGMKVVDVARLFNRDHTSVTHATKCINSGRHNKLIKSLIDGQQ